MNRYIKILTLLSALIGLTACGTTSEEVGAKNQLTVETKRALINKEHTNLSLDFTIRNDYSQDIKVEVKDLSIAVSPCVVKGVKMTPTEIEFSPSLKQQNVNALIEFDDSCIPKSYAILGLNKLILNGESNQLSYQSPKKDFVAKVVESSSTSEGSNSNVEKKDYTFYNTPAPITVDKANQEYIFKVQLINSKSIGVASEVVSVLAYDITYGEIKQMTVATDANGFATFNFKSPKSLDNLNGRDLKLTLIYDNGFSKLSTNVKFHFNASTITPSTYQFKNQTSIVVEHFNEQKNITVDLVNGSGVGVAEKEIQITNIPSKFGMISSSTSKTNSAGRATFVYTSPATLDDIDGQSTTATLTFTEDGTTISTRVTIKIKKSTKNREGDKTLPTVVVPSELRKVLLTTNSKSIDIAIKVFKNISPYTKGSVNVELPKKVLDGADVGSFSSFSVPVNENGVAIFNYTGPANLKALIDAGDKGSIFKFYHSENTAEESRQSMEVEYKISADTYVPIDYALSVNTQNNDFSMGIPELQKTFSIVLKDRQGNIIKEKDVQIKEITVETTNGLIAKILDTSDNSLVNKLTLRNENNAAFIIKSKKLSGIVPLRAVIKFIDINGQEKELSTIVNVRVMSGPPSAISVSYVSTGQDKDRAKYIEKFAVSVTDEYGNKVNTRPYISLGALVGYTVDGKERAPVESNITKRLFYGRDDIATGRANGQIVTLGDEVNTTNFEDNTDEQSNVFRWVNNEGANTDKLVVFGAGKNYEAMGKWDFKKIADNFNRLTLEDDYFGTDRDGLYYAVGHNYYQDQCRDDGREWLGSTDSESYQLDDEGTVVVSYKYDYHLTGKDALVWVNLNGFQADTAKDTRIGEVVKHTLRGVGLKSIPAVGYHVLAGQEITAKFEIHHENAAEWYRNAKFGYRVLPTKCSYTRIDWSDYFDARTCYNGGTGVTYVTFYVTAPVKDCTFNIGEILVRREF